MGRPFIRRACPTSLHKSGRHVQWVTWLDKLPDMFTRWAGLSNECKSDKSDLSDWQQFGGCNLLAEQVAACKLLGKEFAACKLLAEQVASCYLLAKQVTAGNLLGKQLAGCNLLSEQVTAGNLLAKQVAA
ncbi:hypothetical protein PCANC_28845 [Puccinia coronata f. sp. avenae]|uniref:Uncharacterized protein n=1 Tax=Puccinia coronata f. sp. avenae TaxID=200324 RepID=A0A2N5THF1_9BASI|nr:hypothetical protein PCANC_28845 [Puccinia coronata f. sp. avenae]